MESFGLKSILAIVVLSLSFLTFVTEVSCDKYSLPSEPLKSHNSDATKKNQKENVDPTFEEAYEKLRTFDSLDSLGGGLGTNFIKPRLYNTSIALTASFFSYYLPQTTKPGTVTDFVNQAVYGLFGVLAVVLIYAVPLLITGVQQEVSKDTSRSMKNDDEDEEGGWIKSNLMSVEQFKNIFNEKFRDEIGLDSTKCLQKTICEAHRSPKNKKYGMLALPFQMFFPPPANGVSEGRATSYQIAAKDGKYSKKDCAKRYKCFFDTLDLGTFLIDWYRLSSDPEYVPTEADFY